MCIRAGKDELESVRNLMAMSLTAVVSESLDVDIDDISDFSSLKYDLKMDDAKKQTLKAQIADIFDGLELNIDEFDTFADLLDKVVMVEFEGMPVEPVGTGAYPSMQMLHKPAA
jgi:hypothetical protein